LSMGDEMRPDNCPNAACEALAAAEGQLESQRSKLNALLADAYRRLTDYTMVQELAGGLAETLAEEKVVDKVFGFFSSLLAPATMAFASIHEGKLDRVWARPPEYGEKDETKKRLAEFRRSYAWTAGGTGLSVGIRHRSKLLGVLELDGISSTEYREHYLDMALTVARLMGLAISNARLYRDLKGPNRSYIEFAEDLEDALAARKRAEEKQAQLLKQVESANQELADFAHVVSHDLKAPLRAIDTLARWLVADYRDRLDDEGRVQMNLLISRVDRMRALIDGILQYSRAGRQREERTEVDLAQLLPEVVDLLAPPAHIHVEVEPGLPVVVAEKTRIEQVFQNLLSNAIKYMDKPEGHISVGCRPSTGPDRSDYWFFSVADNGPGIEEKDFARVFQLFQTLKPRDETDSTGVGLAVVKKVVEMHGGRVWVESTVGKGSTFYFTLPKCVKGEGS
jgi:signal transduction histidine kinase